MVKGNQPIPCQQNKKDVHPLIKTWLNQPARKLRRRQARQAKMAANGLKPINKLRPVVQCCSQKYNFRARAGRGFSTDELKAVGLSVRHARTIGIAADCRRVNHNKEGLERNVARLQEYLAKLVVFPKKAANPREGRNGIPADTTQSAVEGKNLVHKINNKVAHNFNVVVN